MPGEFVSLCSCKITNLERTPDDKIRLELECDIQTEAGELGHRSKEEKKLLAQAEATGTREVLLEQRK